MEETLSVLLADDEPLALRRLMIALREFSHVEVVGTARDGDATVDEAIRLRPDLLIVDVEMPGRDGLAVARALDSDGGPDIIVLSAFDRYAAAAFEIEAVDYLLKPLQPGRLRQAIERARRRRAQKAALLASSDEALASDAAAPVMHIPGRHGGHEVPLADVIWIEAARDYVVIHTATRSHLMRATMTEMANRLPDTMVRVHRSAFVTLSQVRRWGIPLKGIYCLVLSDDSEIAVGPSYIRDVRTALRSLDA